MHPRFCLLIALLLPLQVFAQPLGKITFMEGKVRVIRDASLMAGAQGAVVESADIIETTKPGFALVEFSDGTVIALGDATRVMIASAPGAAAEVRLLEGWLKVQARLADKAAAYSVISSLQAAAIKNGSLILHSTAEAGEVFVESGAASLGVADKRGRPSSMVSVKAGQFVTRAPEKLAVSQPRANEVFMSAMPGAFKDALPARLERFKDRTVESKATGPVSYGDVADWLTAAQSWRSGFVKRFEPRLSDPAFRQQLDVHLKSHPEWDKILHPSPTKASN